MVAEGMWQQILLQMHFWLHFLRTGISFSFLKAKSGKKIPCSTCLSGHWSPFQAWGSVNSPALWVWDLLFSTKAQRRVAKKEESVLGGMDGNPGDVHFVLSSLVKPFEMYSWKFHQKRLALLIKAFTSFLLGRRWNAVVSVWCSDSCKDIEPWTWSSTHCHPPCFSAMLTSAFISFFWAEKFQWILF